MSYVTTPMSRYQLKVPGTPTAEAVPGWLASPVPMWGANHRLAGARRLAIGADVVSADSDELVKSSSEAVDIAAQAAETAVVGIPKTNWILLGMASLVILGGAAVMLRDIDMGH